MLSIAGEHLGFRDISHQVKQYWLTGILAVLANGNIITAVWKYDYEKVPKTIAQKIMLNVRFSQR